MLRDRFQAWWSLAGRPNSQHVAGYTEPVFLESQREALEAWGHFWGIFQEAVWTGASRQATSHGLAPAPLHWWAAYMGGALSLSPGH